MSPVPRTLMGNCVKQLMNKQCHRKLTTSGSLFPSCASVSPQCCLLGQHRSYSSDKMGWYSENKALFTAGVSKPKTRKQTTKKPPKETVLNASKKAVSKKSEKGSEQESSIRVPGLSSFLQSCPFRGEEETIDDEHEEFKSFVEGLPMTTLPSVGTVISKTLSPSSAFVLERWKIRKTQELGGEEQFSQYQSETLNTGVNFHTCIQDHLMGKSVTELSPSNEGHWKSVQPVLSKVTDVVSMEEEVVHPDLLYRGKFDCVAKYKGQLCLVEWKTSSKPRPLLKNTYENPLQVAAYMGAVNRSLQLSMKGAPEVTTGLLVVAYQTGLPASAHLMDLTVCETYWKQWLQRLEQYWALHVPQ